MAAKLKQEMINSDTLIVMHDPSLTKMPFEIDAGDYGAVCKVTLRYTLSEARALQRFLNENMPEKEDTR